MTVGQFFMACLTGLGVATLISIITRIVIAGYAVWVLSADKRRAKKNGWTKK